MPLENISTGNKSEFGSVPDDGRDVSVPSVTAYITVDIPSRPQVAPDEETFR